MYTVDGKEHSYNIFKKGNRLVIDGRVRKLVPYHDLIDTIVATSCMEAVKIASAKHGVSMLHLSGERLPD